MVDNIFDYKLYLSLDKLSNECRNFVYPNPDIGDCKIVRFTWRADSRLIIQYDDGSDHTMDLDYIRDNQKYLHEILSWTVSGIRALDQIREYKSPKSSLFTDRYKMLQEFVIYYYDDIIYGIIGDYAIIWDWLSETDKRKHLSVFSKGELLELKQRLRN